MLSVRRPSFAWFGYATTLVTFIAFILLTKQSWEGKGFLLWSSDWEVPTIAFVTTLTCGQVSLLLAWARRGSLVRGLGLGGSAVIVVLAVLIVLEIIADIEIGDRVYGVLTILYLLPLALLPLFTLGRERSPESPG